LIKPLQKEPVYYSYLPSIDILRFIVFLFILANHTRVNNALNGHSFFFTLTGFLISYISISEIRHNLKFNFRRYIARRFLRTLPLFFLIVCLTFLGGFIAEFFLNKPITTGRIWPYLLLIQNFFDQNLFFPLANLWAIGVTEQFYILFGVLFLFFYRNYKWIGWVFLFLGLIINMASYYLFNYYNYTYSWYFFINFGIGNILAVFCTDRKRQFQAFSNMRKTATFIYILMAVLLLLWGFMPSGDSFLPYKELILSVGYSVIIFNFGFARHKISWIANSGKLQYLGKRTLGMYCWHAPIITILEKAAGHYNVNYTPLFMFITTLVLVIPISILSYRYYESYFLRFKRRFN
jgi:peptidoglycan/LPS O-acetylase OafA/YrhL